MANYKVKWHLNPINGICIALLVYLAITRGKPDTEPFIAPPGYVLVDSAEQYPHYEWVGRKMYDDEYLLRSYQLQLSVGPNNREYVVMYDYERVVGVLPLDNKCNLTELIFKDNE